MQVRQSDITKRIFLQRVEGWAPYLAPWWPGRSGLACWANVRSSGQRQRHLPESHTWDTPVLDSLNKREKKLKNKNTFSKFIIQINPSTVNCDINRSKFTATHVEPSSLCQIVLLKKCCETCSWEGKDLLKIWSHSFGIVHSSIHVFPLTWPYAVWRPSGNLI